MTIEYQQLAPRHFDAIVTLGNRVHGDNYIDNQGIRDLYERSWQDDVNASWVAIDDSGKLLGFRLTVASNHWQPDQWCTPAQWGVNPEHVCYFKCNTVDELARGKGVGSSLLRRSIASAQQQGAIAGLAHIWLASPNNSAYGYFSACGGELVKKHPNKWQIRCIEDGYECPVCKALCTCTATEMILKF